MSTRQKTDRRTFIKTSAAAAGGLLLSFYLPENDSLAAQGPPRGPAPLMPNAFVHIGADDVVTLTVHKPENGQGTETSIAMLLAEELECDWQKVRTVFAPINPAAYGGPLQGTFGSQAIRTSWTPMLRTGAAAREMLLQAAAQRWGVDKSQCRAENSTIVNQATNARVSFGAVAEAAAKLPVPSEIALKDPSQFRLVGKAMKRRDTPAKTSGKAMYALDMKVPGMLHAVVLRSPVIGGTVASFDATKAKAVPGVKDVVQIQEGLAILADNTWAAMEGRKALQVQWNEGANANLSSAGIRQLFVDLAAKKGTVARNQGQGEAALASAAKKIEAVYEAPYLAHAPMEPHTCVAHVRQDGCEVWSGTQIPGATHSAAVQASGLPADKVKVHTLYMGGSFGSRGGAQVISEAVRISKAAGVAVKVTWTRDDELQHSKYRPASYIRFAAGLDADGWPTAWTGRVVCSSFAGLNNGIDREAIAGVADVLYDIPNNYFEYHEPGLTVPTNFWRSVGHSQNTFFAEGFIDELAIAARKDPVEYRRRLLAKQPRLLGVLELAAEKSGWGKPLPAGRFRGVAVVNCFGSYNAQVAEVSVEQGKVRVHRVVTAVDCGRVVNPAGVVQQMESAIVYGLSAALRGAITIDRGRVQQTNFHQYEPLRINEMPAVEVHIVSSTNASGGIGEVGTPAIAPAVTNAIFAATGKRLRRLPIRPEDLA
jgi:isoquinoline 1-oxidoreductase subunit beta